MSYAHQARKKAIKRGNWNHAAQIFRMKMQGLDTTTLELKQVKFVAKVLATGSVA